MERAFELDRIAAAKAAAPVKPTWQTALEAAAIFSPLLGIGEDADFQDVDAPDLPMDPTSELYGGHLAPPPRDRIHDFGSKRLRRRR
jgi:hypothetical protein